MRIASTRMAAAAVAAIAITAGGAGAQVAFPSRTVQIVAPYSTGTTADILARLLGPRLAEGWKTGVVVENRPGATGAIGIAAAAKARPDGHTLLFIVASYAIIPALNPNLAYDPLKSLAPVTQMTAGPLALVVHPQLPVRNVRDFLRLAKQRPAELFYGSPGNGSAQHLAMELFKLETGTRITHVPYKGLSSALTDLAGGHVQTMISTLQTVQPYVAGNRLRMLAATGARRSPAFPDVPTLGEQGIAVEVETWSGALVPAGTPETVIGKLNTDINALLQQHDMREALVRQGMIPAGGSPDAFAALLRNELARWARVVKAAKIGPD